MSLFCEHLHIKTNIFIDVICVIVWKFKTNFFQLQKIETIKRFICYIIIWIIAKSFLKADTSFTCCWHIAKSVLRKIISWKQNVHVIALNLKTKLNSKGLADIKDLIFFYVAFVWTSVSSDAAPVRERLRVMVRLRTFRDGIELWRLC